MTIEELKVELYSKCMGKTDVLSSPEKVATLTQSKLFGARVEKMFVIYVGSHNQIIDTTIFEGGTIDRCVVHPREIYREALIKDATGIILCHNHPSGYIEPSDNDMKLTLIIKKGLETLDIKFLDHIVVGNKDYYSFLENHIL